MQIQNNSNTPQFTGLCSNLSKDMHKTTREIEAEFDLYKNADGIAGSIPTSWSSKINKIAKTERQKAKSEIQHNMRRAIESLKTNKFKDASKIMTDVAHKFGIIPEENKILFVKRKVKGSQITDAFVMKEYGKKPSLTRVFIKCFKHHDKEMENWGFLDYHGFYPELVRGIFANKKGSKHIVKTFWGDAKGYFLVSEYVVPPTGKYKKPKLPDMAKILRKNGLNHTDLHDENVIIGSYNGKPIWKLVDLGGLVESIDIERP